MNEVLQTLILFAAGSTAGMINVLAGGGSSITLPILILMGLDGATANGTNRIAIFLQSVSAILGFEQKKKNQFRTSFKIALFTLPGAILGTITAITIPDAWFHKILAVVLIFVVISMFISPVSAKYNSTKNRSQKSWIIYPVMVAIGFYGGFIQVGIGFLLMASLFHILKLKLLEVNVHKVFIVMLYNIPSLLIFIFSGNVHWRLGLSLAAGNALGGWIAARISVKKGDNFIRYALAVAIVILALKMIY